MAAMITLKTLVDEIEALGDEHFIYLNPHTGELVMLSSEEISAVEDDLPNDEFRTVAIQGLMIQWLDAHRTPYR